MHGHSVLFQTLSEISARSPEKPQKVTILHRNTHLVKHRLYISHYSHWVLSETKQYSNQVVGQIRTLQQFAIQRHPLELSGTIEDEPLSSQFFCSETPHGVEYIRPFRQLYTDLQREPFQGNLLGLRFEEMQRSLLEIWHP